MTNRLDVPGVTWRRVSPKLAVSELVGNVITWGIFMAATIPLHVVGLPWAWYATGGLAVLLLLSVVFIVRRVRAYGYQLRADDLVFRKGIMFLRVVAVPYGRMQLVDITRGPISRLLGLSELKFVTAAVATGVVIPGLPEVEAEDLRDRLVELAESRRAGL